MFRRSSEPATLPADDGSTGLAHDETQAKGRPTPTRKDAEAAARARARAVVDPKGSRKKQRGFQAERSRDIRAGMKNGEERYLPPRDKGPVRRFIRDYVDHRLCMAEFAMPLLVVSLVASATGAVQVGNGVMNATLIVTVLDSVFLRFRLRSEIRKRFPEASVKRTTWYALMRSLQLRFMRLPKAQVKVGQTLPAVYR